MQDQIAERGFLERAKRAIQNPSRAVSALWSRLFPHLPVPIRLSFGAWWLAQNDYSGRVIRGGGFETAELVFAQRFLLPGMTALDIGAHQGFYSLLASIRVGRDGRVFSFEPSPRERAALVRHVKLNGARNISVEGIALGCEEKSADLYVINQDQTGCNSLRQPASDVREGWTPTEVKVATLDGWLTARGLTSADFVKLDVEGGELDVLKGASAFLEHRPRPVFLVEVQDIRTEGWGYPAKEIISFLAARGFQWFSLLPDGSFSQLDVHAQSFEGNYVAWPEEYAPQRLATFLQNTLAAQRD